MMIFERNQGNEENFITMHQANKPITPVSHLLNLKYIPSNHFMSINKQQPPWQSGCSTTRLTQSQPYLEAKMRKHALPVIGFSEYLSRSNKFFCKPKKGWYFCQSECVEFLCCCNKHLSSSLPENIPFSSRDETRNFLIEDNLWPAGTKIPSGCVWPKFLQGNNKVLLQLGASWKWMVFQQSPNAHYQTCRVFPGRGAQFHSVRVWVPTEELHTTFQDLVDEFRPIWQAQQVHLFL